MAVPTTEQWNEFWAMGDVNRDGYINQTDLDLINDHFGCIKGLDECYDSTCDINSDDVVDIRDVTECQMNQGLDIWGYFNIPHATLTVSLRNFPETAVNYIQPVGSTPFEVTVNEGAPIIIQVPAQIEFEPD